MCQLDICWKRCQVAYDGDLDCLREDGFSAKVMLVLSPICNEETTCKIWRRYIRKVLGSGTLGTRQAIPCWGSQKGHTLPLPMGKYRSSGPVVGRSVWKRPVRTCRECASPLSPHVWKGGTNPGASGDIFNSERPKRVRSASSHMQKDLTGFTDWRRELKGSLSMISFCVMTSSQIITWLQLWLIVSLPLAACLRDFCSFAWTAMAPPPRCVGRTLCSAGPPRPCGLSYSRGQDWFLLHVMAVGRAEDKTGIKYVPLVSSCESRGQGQSERRGHAHRGSRLYEYMNVDHC